jgi:hypothetical protein
LVNRLSNKCSSFLKPAYFAETVLKQITKKCEKEQNIEKEKPFKIKDFKGF